MDTSQQSLRNFVELSLNKYFEHLDGHPPQGVYQMVLNEVHIGLLRALMRTCKGNQTKAAETLGVSRSTLRKLLDIHKLEIQSVE